MAPPMELESVGLGVAQAGSRAEKTSLSWALEGLRGLGEQATPLKTSPGGSRAPWSLCLEALEAACHREK